MSLLCTLTGGPACALASKRAFQLVNVHTVVAPMATPAAGPTFIGGSDACEGPYDPKLAT